VLAGVTERLVTDAAAGDIAMSVWSRAAHATFPIVRGHVDNAFDVQRRRGVDASQREVWPA